MSSRVEDIVIIGSGPAAWTAAIYAARANLSPLVYEGGISERNRIANTLPGGQLSLTTEVENFPGFPDGVDGGKLIQQMRQQAIKFGTRVVTEDIRKLEVRKDVKEFFVYADADDPVATKTVIVATGAGAMYLGLESEQKYLNKGVSACAVCDGALPRFRDQNVLVVGGGDSACEEALYLTKFAKQVYMVVRRDELKASRVMARRVESHEKIAIIYDTIVREIHGNDEDGVTSVTLGFSDNFFKSKFLHKPPPTHIWNIDVAGVFVAIGHRPNTGFLETSWQLREGAILVDTHGFIRTFTGTTTSIPGIFAAGDVSDPVYKQAITAAGRGCMAALDAEKYLAAIKMEG